MTVQQLICQLRQTDPNAEVKFACQNHFTRRLAAEYSICGVIQMNTEVISIVYIGEGEYLGYLPRNVYDEFFTEE